MVCTAICPHDTHAPTFRVIHNAMHLDGAHIHPGSWACGPDGDLVAVLSLHECTQRKHSSEKCQSSRARSHARCIIDAAQPRSSGTEPSSDRHASCSHGHCSQDRRCCNASCQRVEILNTLLEGARSWSLLTNECYHTFESQRPMY